MPQELLEQLAPNGVLVIPVGGDEVQELQLIYREGQTNKFDVVSTEDVRFVPLLPGVRV